MALLKNLITFQVVEDTSFFEKAIKLALVVRYKISSYWNTIIKVLGVKHSCKIKLMQQIVGNCPTNHLAVGI